MLARAPQVFIGGSYGHRNAGDEAILAAMLAHLGARRPDLRAVVASGDPERTVADHGTAAVSSRDIRAIVGAIGASDLVLLSGGLLEEHVNVPPEAALTARHGRMLTHLAYPALAALLGKPAMLYAVGVGPLASEEGRRLIRIAVSLTRRVTVRDARSAALLEQIGCPGVGPAVEITADPAFDLAPGDAARVATRAGIDLAASPLCAVVLRHWSLGVDPAVWERDIARALDQHLESRPGRLLLLPFQVAPEAGTNDDDLAVLRRVRGHLSDRARTILVEQRLAPAELAALIGRCERVLAMRYHAALFALAARVPVAALAWDPELQNLMAAVGQAHLALAPDQWQPERVASALDRAAATGIAVDWVSDMRRRARRSADLAVELLGQAPPVRTEAARFLADVTIDKVLAVAKLEERLQGGAGSDTELLHVWLDTARIHSEQARLERDRLRAQVQDLGGRLEQTAAERDGLAAQVDALEGTLAVQLLHRYWQFAERALPGGTLRRRAYELVRRALGGTIGARISRWRETARPDAVPVGPVAPPPERGAGTCDPWAELSSFEEDVRTAGAARVAVIFSGTKLVEAEGQRGTHLALELARQGVPVIFAYWRWRPDEWQPQDRLAERIVQVPLDVMIAQPQRLFRAFAGLSRLALFEFPHPCLFETLASANAEGWLTIYDVLDDWEEFHRVGQAVWYDEPFEQHLAHAADAVFAVTRSLADRVRQLGGPDVQVLPNGLRPGVEVIRAPRPLPRGTVTVGYFGYLAGAWFDWGLIAEAARQRPAWRFYLIGYGESHESVTLPGNVVCLGRQPWRDLAAYAANWDVAVVPFKPSALAASADPIKTYEYLAMGLPVVATGVPPPPGGAPFVRCVVGVQAFLESIADAAGDPAPAGARRAFAATCTWPHRVRELLAVVDGCGQGMAVKRALFGGQA